ncbi:unnamed protein product, partial [Arabidopsis halleri]
VTDPDIRFFCTIRIRIRIRRIYGNTIRIRIRGDRISGDRISVQKTGSPRISGSGYTHFPSAFSIPPPFLSLPQLTVSSNISGGSRSCNHRRKLAISTTTNGRQRNPSARGGGKEVGDTFGVMAVVCVVRFAGFVYKNEESVINKKRKKRKKKKKREETAK